MFRRIPTLLVVLLVLASATVPAGAATAATAAADLQVDVQQASTSGDATITVTRNGTAVEGSTVVVSGDSYAGNGTYATDANGTILLPNPASTVDVTIEVYDSGQSTSLTTTLIPRSESLDVGVTQHADGTATATVTQYGDAVENATVQVAGDAYAGNGTYSTDANGTVDLPAPADAVSLNVTAAYDNLSAETATVLHGHDLSLAVEQASDGTTTVTVTRNGSAVENATVRVAGEPYAGNGSYATDANGTVSLPAPADAVNVTITAADSGDTVSKNVTLYQMVLAVEVTQHDDRTATVTVTRNDSAVENATVTVSSSTAYAGNGTYSTDANGTVSLPAPEQDVTIDVTAADEGQTASTRVALSGPSAPAGDLGIGVSQGADRVVIAVTDDGARQNATVTISGNSTLAGTYHTGSDGFIVLDAPSSASTVTISATTGSASAQRTVDIHASKGRGPSHTPFGKYVSAYVDSIHNDPGLTSRYGQYVSEFVHQFRDSGQQGQGHGSGQGEAGNGNGSGGPHGDGHPGNGKAKGKK